MKRRAFICLLSAAALAPAGAAFARSFSDEVVAQLAKQGFTNVTTETTWLGRVRITATRADGQREIILNPRTGEILRDQWTLSSGSGSKPIIDDVGGSDDNSGSGSDDSGGDDNSGSGSDDGGGDDNSGSGSGGSGSDGSGSHSGSSHGGSDDGGSDDHGGDHGGGNDN